ncbi:hypothetical protein [Streptomyces sp. NPDC048527]|uniref:hypothetical protein n=1 Tax=Streptomyces sp. NPDC048527 TaxID=3365568 RepID=UPI0037107E4D
MKNVTGPVGVPDPGATAVTMAVSVLGWPNTVGSGDTLTAVEDDALTNVCVSTGEVEPLWLVLPP